VESLLAECTGPQFAEHFQAAVMREDRLVLLTPTASWATRLRMQAEQMLRFLQKSGYGHLRHIDIRVSPLHRAPAEKKIPRQMSPAAEHAFELMSRLSSRSPDDSKT